MDFFSPAFWAYATAATLAVFGGIGYLVKRWFERQDANSLSWHQQLERSEADTAELEEKLVRKIEEAAELKARNVYLEADHQRVNEDRKVMREQIRRLQWQLSEESRRA